MLAPCMRTFRLSIVMAVSRVVPMSAQASLAVEGLPRWSLSPAASSAHHAIRPVRMATGLRDPLRGPARTR